MLTTANYDKAIAILKKRYGNKQVIISRHMDALMALEAVTSNNNTKALHHLHDKIESNVRIFSALGVVADSYGALLSCCHSKQSTKWTSIDHWQKDR